jgi:glycosyltransferase involved in cell wall biosynthesis
MGSQPQLEAPLRVLMVTTEWPRDPWGGTATFIPRQAAFLQAAGVQVDVFAFRAKRKVRNYAAAWLEVRRRLRRNHYDLIHAQFGQSGVLALPKRVPLVVTFRGDDLQGVLDDVTGQLPLKGRVLQWLSCAVGRWADAIIVVSDHMRSYLTGSMQPHVIPSGIDFDLFRLIPQAEARRQLGLASDKPLVLFVGSPTLARKRYALAREAVDLVNRSLPAELVLGWKKTHQEIALLMNACDALVFTSLQEGSPNAVKEALACDLPVVSVSVGDVAERLNGIDGCELCADDRPETIAAALERVLRRGGRVKGREAVAHLDERLLTDKIVAIYRSVVAPVRARSASRSASPHLAAR